MFAITFKLSNLKPFKLFKLFKRGTQNTERLTLPFPLPVPGRRNAHYFGKSPAKIRSVLKTKFRIDIRNLHF